MTKDNLEKELEKLSTSFLAARSLEHSIIAGDDDLEKALGERTCSELRKKLHNASLIRQLEALSSFLEVFDVSTIRQSLDNLLSAKTNEVHSLS